MKLQIFRVTAYHVMARPMGGLIYQLVAVRGIIIIIGLLARIQKIFQISVTELIRLL